MTNGDEDLSVLSAVDGGKIDSPLACAQATGLPVDVVNRVLSSLRGKRAIDWTPPVRSADGNVETPGHWDVTPIGRARLLREES